MFWELKKEKWYSQKRTGFFSNFLWSFKCDLPVGWHHKNLISILQHSWESKRIPTLKGLVSRRVCWPDEWLIWISGKEPPAYCLNPILYIFVMVIVKKSYVPLIDINNFSDKTFIDKETMLTFSGLKFYQWIEGWLKERSLVQEPEYFSGPILHSL